MALNPAPEPNGTVSPDRDVETVTSPFRVSSDPVISEGKAAHDSSDQGLPRSYGSETLCLMARDPHSLFAYWDIDWTRAFDEETPKQRTVHLRIFNADGSEQSSVEVEPLAGSCYLSVANADASYHGEIGYYDPTSAWLVVGRSEDVYLPPEIQGGAEPADFATVPFHLSFQRMIDALRVAREEDEPLTAMLADLRQRVASDEIAAEQRELLRVVTEAAANQPPAPQGSASPDLWAHQSLERILGFGNSSLGGGFGGSSRS